MRACETLIEEFEVLLDKCMENTGLQGRRKKRSGAAPKSGALKANNEPARKMCGMISRDRDLDRPFSYKDRRHPLGLRSELFRQI